MTPDDFLTKFLDPCLLWLKRTGGPEVDNPTRTFLLAVALQESGPTLTARYQNHPASDPGMARGFFQFEQGGGITGVLTHPTSQVIAKTVCDELSVLDEPAACWRAVEGNDRLATSFARLLLFTDPYPVPTDETEGWNCYLRLWRPGKPHPETWPKNWQTAQTTVAAHQLK